MNVSSGLAERGGWNRPEIALSALTVNVGTHRGSQGTEPAEKWRPIGHSRATEVGAERARYLDATGGMVYGTVLSDSRLDEPMTSFSRPEPSLRFELPHGITIAADAYGNPSAQPVILLHGGGQTRHAWGDTAEDLGKAGFYAIAMDHRGHGDSSWAEGDEYHVDYFVRDLLGVLGQLDRAPVLVGASLGGMTALLAETGSDDLVAKGLILVDITPRMERSGVERIIGFMKDGAQGFASLEEAADAIAGYMPHRKRPKNLAGLAKNLRRDEGGRYWWHWDPKILTAWDPGKYGEKDKFALTDQLAGVRRLSIPTLLIRGRLSDLVSVDNAKEFLDLVPHAEYVDLADAHHMVAGDQNDAFTETVKEFLTRRFSP